MARGLLLVCAVTAVLLLPFAGKAFHIDDPLFIWTARQIAEEPGDFYGFAVNWDDVEKTMAEVTQNPPLTSYYIALVASVAGWSETALHLAFLIPALALSAGAFLLARRLCDRPALAALAGVLTPVFLVSATTVMSDVPMLAVWVWATVLWMRGLEDGRTPALAGAAILMAVCPLFKYFGVSLVPLLLTWSIFRRKRLGAWALLFLLPAAVLAGYHFLTLHLYGQSLLVNAVSYGSNLAEFIREGHYPVNGWIGLAFLGGCLATAAFYLPLLWPWKALVALVAAAGAGAWFVQDAGRMGWFDIVPDGEVQWAFVIQFALFAAVGFAILVLAVQDLWKNRDPGSLLIFLWIAGTFVFAAFINWSANGRSILPAAPAAGILLMRRLRDCGIAPQGKWSWKPVIPLVPAAILALGAAWADHALAGTAREAATRILAAHGSADEGGDTRALRFQGHWGFQYYMQAGGARPIDAEKTRFAPGDIAILPSNNASRSFSEPPAEFDLVEKVRLRPLPWLTTMDYIHGTGFYSSFWGPLPFAFGAMRDEVYVVVRKKGG